MATFHVVLRPSGPQWDPSRPMEEQSDWPAHASFLDGLMDVGFVLLGGPLADEHRVVLAVEAESEGAVRATLSLDPWSEAHLQVDTIDAWTIRLDGSGRSLAKTSGAPMNAPERAVAPQCRFLREATVCSLSGDELAR